MLDACGVSVGDLFGGEELLSVLPRVVQQLTGQEVAGWKKSVLFVPQKVANVKRAVQVLSDNGCSVDKVGAAGLVEGKADDVLALAAALIGRYAVPDRAALAAWVNTALKREGLSLGVAGDGLGAGLANGIAFCALANHALRSQGQGDICVELSTLSPTMGISNFNLAMVLLSHAGVPAVLSPEDIASGATDEMAMAYLLSVVRKVTKDVPNEAASPKADQPLLPPRRTKTAPSVVVVADSDEREERKMRQEALQQLIRAEQENVALAVCQLEQNSRDMAVRLKLVTPAPPSASGSDATDDELAVERMERLLLLRKLKDMVNFSVVEDKRLRAEVDDLKTRAAAVPLAASQNIESLQKELQRQASESRTEINGLREQLRLARETSTQQSEVALAKADMQDMRAHMLEAASLIRAQCARVNQKNAEIGQLKQQVQELQQQQAAEQSKSKERVISPASVMVHHHTRSSQPNSPILGRASGASSAGVNAALEGELKAARHDIARLQRELQSAVKAQVTLPASSVQVIYFNSNDAKTKVELADLKERLARALEEASRVQARIDNSKHFDQLKLEAQQSRKAMLEAREQLSRESASLSKELFVAREQGGRYKMQLEQLEEDSRKKQAALTVEINALKAQLEDQRSLPQQQSNSNENEQKLQAQLEQSERDGKSASDALNDAQQRCSGLEGQLRDAVAAHGVTRSKLGDAEDKLKSSDGRVSELEQELQEADEKMRILSAELKEAAKKSADVSESSKLRLVITTLTDDLADARKDTLVWEERALDLERSNDSLQRKVSALESRLKEAEERNAKRSSRSGELQADVNDARRDASAWEHRAGELSDAIKTSSDREQALKTALAAMAGKLSEADLKMEQSRVSLSAMSKELSDAKEASRSVPSEFDHPEHDDDAPPVDDLEEATELLQAQEKALIELAGTLESAEKQLAQLGELEKKLSDTEALVRTLTEDKTAAEQERDAFEERVDELAEERDELQEQVAELKSQLEEKESSGSADREVHDNSEEVGRLEEAVRVLEEKNAAKDEAIANVERLTKVEASQAEELAALREELSQQKAKADELSEKLAQLDDERRAADEVRETLKRRLEELESRKDNTEQVERLQDKVQSLEAQLSLKCVDDGSSSNAALQAEAERLAKVESAQFAQLAQLQEDLAQKEVEADELLSKLDESESLNQAHRTEAQEKRSEWDAERQALVREWQQKLSFLQRELEDGRRTIDVVERERDAVKESLARERSEWRAERDELKYARQARSEEASEERSEDGRIKELEGHMAELQEELEDTRHSLSKAEERLQEVTSRIEAETKKVEARNLELEKLRDEMEGLQEDNDRLNDELAAAKSSVESARAALINAGAANSNSGSASSKSDDSELERARRDRAIAMKVKDKVMLENADLQAKLTTLRRESMSRTSMSGEDDVRALLIQREGELAALKAVQGNRGASKSDLEDARREASETRAQLEEMLTKLREAGYAAMEKEEALEEANAVVQEREVQLQKAEERLGALKSELASASALNSELKAKRNKTKLSAKEKKRRVGELESQIEEARKMDAVAAAAQERVREMEAELERSKAAENRVSELEKELEEAKAAVDEAMEAISDREERLAQLRNQIAVSQEAQATAAAEAERDEQGRARLRERIADLQKELTKAQEEASLARRGIVRVESELEDARSQVARAESAADEAKARLAYADQQLELKNSEYRELEQSFRRAEDDADALRSKLAAAKAEAEHLASEKTRQEEVHTERARGLRESVSALQQQADEAEQHKQKVAELEQQVKCLEKSARKYETMIDESREQAQAAERSVSNLEIELKSARQEASAVTTKLQATKNQLADTKAELEDSHSAQTKAERQRADAVARMEEAVAESEESVAKRKELEAGWRDLEKRVETSRLEATLAEERAQASEKLRDEVLQKLETQDELLENMRKNAAKLKTAFDEEYKQRAYLRDQVEEERAKIDKVQSELDALHKTHEKTLADMAKTEKLHQQRLANAPPPVSKLEEAKRAEELLQARRRGDELAEKIDHLDNELKLSRGWQEREHKWREALRLVGERENAARRALVAAEDTSYKRLQDFETELRAKQSLATELSRMRTLLEEEQDRYRTLKAATDDTEMQRRGELVVQLENVIHGQKNEIAVLQSRVTQLEGVMAASERSATLGDEGAAAEENALSEATRNVFAEQVKLLQTKVTHEHSWRLGVEQEVKALQRVILHLHDVISRQAQVIQASEIRMAPDQRKAVKVATLRKEKVKRLRDARKAHGPSASRLLMLADVIQFASTTDVFGDDKGESQRSLAAAIENYIRADQTASKKLRKKHGDLKRDAFGESAAQNGAIVRAGLNDSQYARVAEMFDDFVRRQQLDARVVNADENVFRVLDAVVLPVVQHEKDRGLALSTVLKNCVEKFAEGKGGLAAYEVLHRVVERYCELRWQQ